MLATGIVALLGLGTCYITRPAPQDNAKGGYVFSINRGEIRQIKAEDLYHVEDLYDWEERLESEQPEKKDPLPKFEDLDALDQLFVP